MSNAAQKQALKTVRWELLAAAQPVVDAAGGARVRTLNHLGHTVDIYFPPAIWRWVAASTDSLCVTSHAGNPTPPPTPFGGGDIGFAPHPQKEAQPSC